MNNLKMKLLQLADKFPDGFTMSLPDGSLLKVDWLWGLEVERSENGMIFREAFGMKLHGDFGEAIVPVHTAGL